MGLCKEGPFLSPRSRCLRLSRSRSAGSMRLHGAIVLLAALLALVTAQQRKWGCGGVFRHPGCAGGGPGCELPVGSVGQPWVSRGTPYGDGLGGGGGIGPPGAELAPGWAVGWVWAPPAPGSAHPLAWGVRSTRRDQRLHCFVQTGTPRGPHPSVHRRCHGDPVGTACRSQWGREGTRGERSPHPAPRCSSAERHMKELWAAPCDGLCPTPQPEPITWPWGCAGGLSAVPSHPRPLSRRRRWPEPRWR